MKNKNKSISLTILLDIARMSKSGYYKWKRMSSKQDKDHNDYLLIKEQFNKGKKKWGYRTIFMKLKDNNTPMNHKKIKRIMRKYGLKCKIRRKNPYREINKKTQEHKIFENLLNREFNQVSPYQFFCTDISYLPYEGGFAYLSVVKDITTKETIAWNLSRHIDMKLVLDTIEYMKNNTNISSLEGVLIHSDQGFHYTNPAFIASVKELGMVQSMSRKANCIDNAPIESFFGHMKDEIEIKPLKTFKELKKEISEYMEYYNHKRGQWGLKKMAPVQYRNHLLNRS